MLYAMHGGVSLIAGERHPHRFVSLCPWAFRQTKNPPSGLPAGSAGLLPESVALPTIVADAHTNADARRPEADAGTRTVIPVTIGTALDVSLARCVIVRIPDNDAAAATAAIASSVITTDHTHGLHERQIRTCVFAARIESAAFAALTANSAPAPASTVIPNFLMGSSVRYCPKTKTCSSFSFPKIVTRR
jgi:hypothetical protein